MLQTVYRFQSSHTSVKERNLYTEKIKNITSRRQKMAEVKIIYWSGTGNTAAMAQSVADGVTAAGAEAKIIPVETQAQQISQM